MTRRKVLQPKRASSVRLDANEEITAVAWRAWWVVEDASRPTWWSGISAVHGEKLLDKWRAACPGTRPAFWWIVHGHELELVAQPDTLDASRSWIDVGGRRFWYAGPPWQPSQHHRLRELGELDGRESARHREWVSGGAAVAYPVEDGWSCEWLYPGVSHVEKSS